MRRFALLSFAAGWFCALLAAAEPGQVVVESISIIPNIRTRERHVEVRLNLPDEIDRRTRAARVIISQAQDDTGAALVQSDNRAFYRASVGRVAGDVSRVTSRQPLSFSLSGFAMDARALRVVEGTVEAVVSDNDPDAVVIAERVSSRLGVPLYAPAFARAGVTLTLIGSETNDPILTALREGMLRNVAGSPPPENLFRVGEDEIGVSLHDPEGRVVAMEFQTSEGAPLRYNHNGNAHYEGVDGRRVDVFRIPGMPADARFVCWVRTEKSVVKLPLKLADVAVMKL